MVGTDDLAPCDARTSAVAVLNMQDNIIVSSARIDSGYLGHLSDTK